MKISPSVKADALEKNRPPLTVLRKREQTSFPVHTKKRDQNMIIDIG